MKNTILIFLLFFLPVANIIAGGPWPQKKGKGFYKLSEWWIVFDQHYTDVGLFDPNVTTGIFNTYAYAEYGITNRLTGVFNAALFSRNYMNNLISTVNDDVLVKGEALNSFGDIDLSFKYGLNKPGAKIPIAVSLSLGIPTGKTTGGAQGNLQTGDGEFNQMLQFDIGHGFRLGKKISSYVSAYAGVNNRTKGFSDEFRYGIEYGMGFFDKKLWLTGRINGIESFKNGETAAGNTSTSIFANNTEYASVTAEASFYLTKKIGVSASMAGAFKGAIIAAAPSYTVGVFCDLSK